MSDLTELELPDTMKTDFPDPTDVLNFTLTITPDEGELLNKISLSCEAACDGGDVILRRVH